MWDKADLQARKDILRTDVGRVINVSNISGRELYSLFQAQVLHPILDVHVLSQIIDRLGDELRQTKSISEDNINLSLYMHVPSLLVISSNVQPGQRAFSIISESKLGAYWIVRRRALSERG
jgi:hypothetical protein